MCTKSSTIEESLFFLQKNPDPMWIFDHDTLQFLEVNNAAVLKYGYSRTEFLRMKITQIRPRNQVPQLFAGITPFRLAGKRFLDRQHLTKDGRIIDVEITALQFYFKGRPAVLVEVRDITERKRAEEVSRKLVRTEERSRIQRQLRRRMVKAFSAILLELEEAENQLQVNPGTASVHISQARKLARKTLAETSPDLDNVSTVLAETISTPSKVASKLAMRLANADLTNRELDVLHLLAAGNSNKQISNALHVTEGTIKIHVSHILRKLNASARTEAASIAFKKGLIELD